MSKFRVEKLVDAFIVYSLEVDGASEEEAMDIAQNSNDEGWEFEAQEFSMRPIMKCLMKTRKAFCRPCDGWWRILFYCKLSAFSVYCVIHAKCVNLKG